MDRRIAEVGTDEFLALADYHRIGPILHERLHQLDRVPPDVLDGLLEMRLQAQAVRLHAMHVLRELRRILDVPFLVVKGPVLSSSWYAEEQEREFGDVDVLVKASDFGEAYQRLSVAGSESLATNWHGFLTHEVAEIPLRLGSTTIDLHWDLIALGRSRRHLHLRTRELFDNAVDARVGDIDVRTLDPVDTLLHLCVNTGLDGAHRLRGLLDVHTVVTSGRVDLEEFVIRAAHCGASRLCAAVLQRSRNVVGTELPDDFITMLSPSRSWILANHTIDQLGLRARGHTPSVAPGVLMSAGRSSTRATIVALGKTLQETARERSGNTSLGQVGGELDWRRLPERGDVEEHRQKYLDLVATQDDQIHRIRCSDAQELHRRIGMLQPRTTPMLGAALLDGLRGRRARADLFEFGDGALGAAVVRYRWRMGGVTAYPLVLDPRAAPTLGEYLDRSSVTDLSGMELDVDPLRPHLRRWLDESVATPAWLPPGFVWEEPPDDVRIATQRDLDALVEVFWQYSPHAFPNRWLLKRRLRRAIDQLVLVVERGTPPRPVGFAVLDSSTPEYDFWAQLVVVPEHRGEGLSWDLVAAGAAQAARRGAGGMVCVVESNPMALPDDSTAEAGWSYVSLSPPRRVRGEPRIRQLVDLILAAPRRSPHLGESQVTYRQPGATDDLLTERRSQGWWQDR